MLHKRQKTLNFTIYTWNVNPNKTLNTSYLKGKQNNNLITFRHNMYNKTFAKIFAFTENKSYKFIA